MKQEIKGLDEIRILVDEFYAKIRQDELLAPIFIYRLSDYWEPHLEKMYAFWNAALFGAKGYNGNPFARHATMEIGALHFEKWLSLFNEVVDDKFEGEVAEDAKRRAEIMAAMFHSKLNAASKNDIYPAF